MEAKEANPMALDADDLRDVDRDLLVYLREGRVTPAYARDRMIDEGRREVTSTYLGQRLQRLEEHDHVVNLYGNGLYELVDDPEDSLDKGKPICPECGRHLEKGVEDERGDYFCGNCNVLWPEDDISYIA
jgi:hypothetical protein